MDIPRFRFTIRTFVIVILLFGVNLAAGIAVYRHYPREAEVIDETELSKNLVAAQAFKRHTGPVGLTRARKEGLSRMIASEEFSGLTKTRPKTLWKIWCPVIASVTLTSLASILALVWPAMRRCSRNPDI